MPIVSGVIVIGTPWLQSRTRGVVIAEVLSRFYPRYAPVPPAGPPVSPSAATAAEEQAIDLAWSNGAALPSVTEIWVSNDGVGGWALLATVPLAQTTYKHFTGAFNVTRFYRFRHVNVTDNSAYTAVVSATSQVDLPGGAPSSLAATVPTTRPAGETTATVSWANSDATAATRIYRRPVGGTFALVNTAAPTAASWLDSGLVPNTAYEWQAVHEKSGVLSSLSNIASATTLVDGPDADPTSLVATGGTGVAGQGKNNLTWTNGDATALTYIYAATASGGTLSLVGTVGTGVSSFTHAVGAFAAVRYYKVRHFKNGVYSVNYSNESSATSGQDIPDADPTGLAVVVPARPTGETQLVLNWTNGDATAQTRIYRGGALLTTVAAGVVTFTDTGRTPNTAYSYQVEHLKNSVASGRTAAVSGTTLVDGPDAPPTSLTAGNPGAGQVNLTWTNGDATAATEVYRTVNGVDTLVATVAAGVAAYIDAPGGNTVVAYKVRHMKNAVVSAYSNSASLTTLAAPGAPTLSSVTAQPGQFTLAWTNSDPAATPVVFRSADGSTFTEVAALAAATAGYTDNGAYAELTVRYFKVAARKNGFDVFSGTLSATTPDIPNAPPTALAGANNGAGNVTLTWTNGDATAATEVLRAGTVIATVAPGTAVYAYNQGANATYSYTVRHAKNGYTSAQSNAASITTGKQPAGAPTLTGVTGGDGRFDLAWTNADVYSQVEVYGAFNSGSYSLLTTLAAGTASYALTGRPKDQQGQFYLRHKNDGYASANSASLTAYTNNPPVAASGLVVQNVAWNYGEARWTVNDTGADTSMGLYYRVQGAGPWSAVASWGLDSAAVGSVFNVALPALMPQTTYEVLVELYRRDRGGRDWWVDSSVVAFTTPQLPVPSTVSSSYLGADNNARGGDYAFSWTRGATGVVTEWALTRPSDGAWLANGEWPLDATGGEADANIGPNTAITAWVRHRKAWGGTTVYSAWLSVFSGTTPGDNLSGVSAGGGTVNNVRFLRNNATTLWFLWDEAGNSQPDNNAYDWEIYYPSGALHSSGYEGRTGATWFHFASETQTGVWMGRVRWRVNGYVGPWQSATFNNGTPVPTLQVFDVSACMGDVPQYMARIVWTATDVETEVQLYNTSTGAWGTLYPPEPKGANGLYHVGVTEEPTHILAGPGTVTYRARHLKNGSYSAWSASASATIGTLNCNVPPSAPPSGLTATNTSVCSGTTPVYRAVLNWTNGDTTAQTRVYRGSTLVTTAVAGGATYTVNNAPTGTYTYTVRHYKNGVESTGSSYTLTVGAMDCSSTGGGGGSSQFQ